MQNIFILSGRARKIAANQSEPILSYQAVPSNIDGILPPLALIYVSGMYQAASGNILEYW